MRPLLILVAAATLYGSPASSAPLDAVQLQQAVDSLCSRAASRPAASSVTPGAVEPTSAFGIERLAGLLKSQGYGTVTVKSESVVTFLTNGVQAALIRLKDGDLQLYFSVSGGKWLPEDLNPWNRDRRLSRAYIDAEGDPVVEGDLLMDAGMTEAQFLRFIAVYCESTLPTFREYLTKTNRAQ